PAAARLQRAPNERRARLRVSVRRNEAQGRASARLRDPGRVRVRCRRESKVPERKKRAPGGSIQGIQIAADGKFGATGGFKRLSHRDLRSFSRKEIPLEASRSSSFAEQSQSLHAQCSCPLRSRQRLRACASCTLSRSKYSSQYSRSSARGVGQ